MQSRILFQRLYKERDLTEWLGRGHADALPTNVWKLFWHFLKPVRKRWLLLGSLSIINQQLSLLMSYAIKHLIDGIALAAPSVKTESAEWIAIAAAAPIFLIIITRTVMSWGQWFISYRTAPMFSSRMSAEIYSYVQRHRPTFFDDRLSGAIIQKSSAMAMQLDRISSQALWDVGPGLVYFITAFTLVATVSVPLSFGLLVWFILFFIVAYRVGRRAFGETSQQLNEERAKLTGLYADVIGNMRTVRLFARGTTERQNILQQASAITNRAWINYLGTISVRFVSQLMVLSTWFGLLGFGLYGWAQGTVTVGELAMLSTIAILFLQRATDLAESLPDIVDNFSAAQDSAKTLFATPLPRDMDGAQALQVSHGPIAIDRLNFAYAEGTPIFSDFSLTIPAGQRVGLIGPSGAGKSTLINLILRLYDTQGGEIAIDGQDAARVTANSLHEAIAVIPQDTQLLHRSVTDNIRYGRLKASDAEVQEAARQAEAHDFIMQLPQGYDSLVWRARGEAFGWATAADCDCQGFHQERADLDPG